LAAPTGAVTSNCVSAVCGELVVVAADVELDVEPAELDELELELELQAANRSAASDPAATMRIVLMMVFLSVRIRP